jgi:protein-S-isoprenylcysteine O-methyltransferase Ste14
MARKTIQPPLVLLIAILAMLLLHWIFRHPVILSARWALVGVVPIAIGLMLNYWVWRLYRRAGTTTRTGQAATRLILEGPYRLSRHPMYIGMILVLIGLGLCLGSLTQFIVIPAFVYYIRQQYILPEEGALEEEFGDTYTDYKNRVRRWL